MRNDWRRKSQSQGREKNTGGGGGAGGGIFRAFSNYVCNVNVSASASSVISTVRSAGASVASSLLTSDEDRCREQVHWAGFDKLEVAKNILRRVLLLAYENGFQVWDMQDSDDVRELVSKRDGRVAFMRTQPWPFNVHNNHNDDNVNTFKDCLPLLLIITGDDNVSQGTTSSAVGGISDSCGSENMNFTPTLVGFYSLRSHAYVHTLRFRSAICAVRCSNRIVAVALETQIYCFDAGTLENIFTVVTYPVPQGPGCYMGYSAMDVGSRWIAYAANHPPVQHTGRVSPKSVSLSSSPLNGNIVAHYAKESSKQLAAGIVTLGDMGYKKLSKYCSEFLTDVASPPRSGITVLRNGTNSSIGYGDPENAGTVVVKDFVSKVVVAQFKAHKSPLSALCFDPSGTLLVTASTQGHNINVFRIMPLPLYSNSGSGGVTMNSSYLHLYSLHRGMTNAIIQDISFSDDSSWIAVSSSRGTSHLFVLTPFGGALVPHAHGSGMGNFAGNSTAQILACPWVPNNRDTQSLQHPVTLYDVYKIKNGNEGWCSTISGAAAVATGRSNLTGTVAVAFHNGKCKSLQSQFDYPNPKNQVWVFSPPGQVTRYALHLYAQYSRNPVLKSDSHQTSAAENTCTLVRPLQKWDLGRKSNWIEREDDIIHFGAWVEKGGSDAYSERKGEKTFVNYDDSSRFDTRTLITEDKHRLYISNAEVHMYKQRIPTWAKSEILFQMITPEASFDQIATDGGEFEIERLPVQAVEVRRKDLMPVFENFHSQGNVASNVVPKCIPEKSSAGLGNELANTQTAFAKESSNDTYENASGNSVQPLVPYSARFYDKFEQPECPSTGGRNTIPILFTGHMSNDSSSSKEPANHMPNLSQLVYILEHGNAKARTVWPLQDSSEVDIHSKMCSEVDIRSKMYQNINYREIDSQKSNMGDLSVEFEDHLVTKLMHAAENETSTLSSDCNSESFGSNPWDGAIEGETISPSSVLHTPQMCKQQLQEIKTLKRNANIHFQDNHIAVNDVKNEDEPAVDQKCTSHGNRDDALEDAPFPLCEED